LQDIVLTTIWPNGYTGGRSEDSPTVCFASYQELPTDPYAAGAVLYRGHRAG